MAAPMAAPRNLAGPRDYRGTAASPGRAVGPAWTVRERSAATVASPAGQTEERHALEAAVAQAADELRALSERSDADSAAILDLQIEMLLDDEMLAPVLARIAQGDSAALAWAGALDAYIDSFGDSPEDIFAVRSADLSDLKNRVLDALAGRGRTDFPEGAIYVGKDMPPSLFLAHDWSKGGGVALSSGSAIGHVSMLARARGVPMVIGLGPVAVEPGETILVDGAEGLARINPAGPAAEPATRSVPQRPAEPTDGAGAAHGAAVGLSVNINALSDLDLFDPAEVEGVGLARTEFLLPSPAEVLNEERHHDCYRRIIERLGGRPVTLRMLDLGGDKALPGLVAGGTGSFLGERGIRLLLARPELARLQARALMRVAAYGPVNVLLPMVTLPDELAAMRLLFEEEAARLDRLGMPHRMPPLGIMVEVPAVALTLDLFAEAAFFSVGTNDLMQYLSAAARDDTAAAHLTTGSETALFRLLDQACAAARALGKPISVCGDLAGDPHLARRLVEAGFRQLSVAPMRLGAVRAALLSRGPHIDAASA